MSEPHNATSTAKVLPYSATSRRGRGRYIRFFLLLMSFGAAVLALRYGPNCIETLAYAYQWRRAMRFTLPPDVVVYEEEPVSARALIRHRDYHAPAKILLGEGWYPKPPAWWSPPACYTPVALDRILTSEKYAVLFAHGRTSAAGAERFVVVRCASFDFGDQGHNVVISGRPYSIGAPQTGTVASGEMDEIDLRLRAGTDHLRIFAGQPDQNDLAHFTIRYEMGEQTGVVDGWLRERPAAKGSNAVRVDLRLHDPESFLNDSRIGYLLFKDCAEKLGIRLSGLDANPGGGNEYPLLSDFQNFYKYHDEKPMEGAFTKQVVAESAAAKAGLERGDLITRVGDRIVKSEQQARAAFSRCRQESSIQITIVNRDGSRAIVIENK